MFIDLSLFTKNSFNEQKLPYDVHTHFKFIKILVNNSNKKLNLKAVVKYLIR